MDTPSDEQQRAADSSAPTDPADTAEHDLVGNEQSEVTLSLFLHQERLGVAYFDSLEGTVYFTETFEAGDFNAIQLLIRRVLPNTVIYSHNTPALEEALTRLVVPQISLLRGEFSFEQARRHIEMIRLPEYDTQPPEIQARAIAALIDAECSRMVCALGALLSHLLRSGAINELEPSDSPLNLTRLVHFSLDGILHIDNNAMDSLQIFKTELHPSRMGIGKAKEGLSLFGILNMAKSAPGRRLLKEWFHCPRTNLNVLASRLDAISFFLHADNLALFKSLTNSMKKLFDLPRILSRICQTTASVKDWISLSKTIGTAIEIRELVTHSTSEVQIIAKVKDCFTDTLDQVYRLLCGCLDFDESTIEHRLIPRPGLDAELDDLRLTYAGLDHLLTELGTEEFQRISTPLVSGLKVLYWPQVGFLTAISRSGVLPLEEYASLSEYGLRYQFHTTEFVYFKSDRMDEMDDAVGGGKDIYSNIVDLENMISREVHAQVSESTSALSTVGDILAELDCLLALAAASKTYDFSRPTLTDENILIISNGRHPLQELVVDQFIPNSVAFSPDREGVLKLVTGPNCSGKSVLLKQVGLIVFLAHIGCYVPAESALIGMTDCIFTRLQSFESMAVQESSFMIDLKQMSKMLRNSSARSLLLVDEFGKGTNYEDGLALLTASMEFFLHKPAHECPKIMVSTHYSELVRKFSAMAGVQTLSMQFIVTEHTDETNIDDLVFLFKSKEVNEVLPSSFALYCAKLAGLSSAVLNRANTVTAYLNANLRVPPKAFTQDEAQQKSMQLLVQRVRDFDCEHDDVDELLQTVSDGMNRST